jgi:hypothetical protein
MSGVSFSFELQILFLVLVFAIGVVAAAYLSLPAALRERSERCAYRRDGSFSDRRWSIEHRQRRKFTVDVLGATLVLSLPLLFTGLLVHQWLFPADLLPEAFSRFEWDPEAWEARLEDDAVRSVVEEHSNRAETAGYSPESVRNLQSALWHGWPVFVLAMLLVTMVSLYTLVRYIRRAVRKFHLELIRRCGDYDATDIERDQERLAEEASPGKQLLLL